MSREKEDNAGYLYTKKERVLTLISHFRGMISHDRKCLPQIFQPNQLAFLIPLVILLIGLTITPAESSSMSIIPPIDKTVTGTSTWTKVALGSPKVIGSTDSTPTISHDAPGSTSPPAGAAAYWSFDYGLEDASGKGNNGVAEETHRL